MPNKNQYRIGASEYQRRYRETHKNFYKVPVVYVWIAPDGIADWVGRGSMERAKSHKYEMANPLKRRDNEWWTPKHILITMTCASEWQAMEYEGKWGQHYLPRYNREGYRYKVALIGGDK